MNTRYKNEHWYARKVGSVNRSEVASLWVEELQMVYVNKT